MIASVSQDRETRIEAPIKPVAGPQPENASVPTTQRMWIGLFAAVVMAGPWFLPPGSTRAPLIKTGPMSSTDSVFRENGAGEDMTAKTEAAIRATPGDRPLLAVAKAGEPEGSYLANLVQIVAWPRVVGIQYLGAELPANWSADFDAIILCHWGKPPVGARVIQRDVVIIDAPKEGGQ